VDFARYYLSGWPWGPWPTIQDFVDTLFWPAVLTLVGRLRRPAPRAGPPAEPARQ